MDDFVLRDATTEDVDLIYKWANDPDERRYSFNPKQIPYEDHCRWYDRRMADRDTYIYILMRGETPIGQCRLEIEGTEGLISYFIDKSYRGCGYGKRILTMLADNARQLPDVRAIKGQVVNDNIPSQKVFLALGYEEKVFEKYKEYTLEIQER